MTVPHDIDAEVAVLARCYYEAEAIQWAKEHLPLDAYFKPQHAWIAHALQALLATGDKPDQHNLVTTMESLGYQVDRMLLLSVMTEPVTRTAMKAAAQRVLEAYHRRRILMGVAEVQQAAADPTVPLQSALDAASRLRQEVPIAETEPAPDLATFLETEDAPHDWVVPGLLEHGDRIIITGSEGLGKSTFTRHLLMSVAHGMHPYSERLIQPRNVLLVDAENSERQLRRALRPLHDALEKNGYHMPPGAFRLKVTNEPLDLKQPAAQRWLYEQVQANRPDVLYIGPLYQIGAVGNDEEAAAKVQGVLDTIRKRWGPAIVMETHSPHGEAGARRPLRPIGASIWMRWPEFGYGLVADKEDDSHVYFTPWRGPRDGRDWPRKLEKGGRFMWRTLDGGPHDEAF